MAWTGLNYHRKRRIDRCSHDKCTNEAKQTWCPIRFEISWKRSWTKGRARNIVLVYILWQNARQRPAASTHLTFKTTSTHKNHIPRCYFIFRVTLSLYLLSELFQMTSQSSVSRNGHSLRCAEERYLLSKWWTISSSVEFWQTQVKMSSIKMLFQHHSCSDSPCLKCLGYVARKIPVYILLCFILIIEALRGNITDAEKTMLHYLFLAWKLLFGCYKFNLISKKHF